MSNINIFSLIFFLLLFTFLHCLPFNDMNPDTLKEFIADSSTCLEKKDENDCLNTNFNKKGVFQSKCCVLKENDGQNEGNSWCVNLSKNAQIRNYILYFNAYYSDIKYLCSSSGDDFIEFNYETEKNYQKINFEIVSGLNIAKERDCFALAFSFQYASGCCFIRGKCGCFSDGITKNEMDILLMLLKIDFNDIKDETFSCFDKYEKTTGTYSEFFESGKIIKLSGFFGLLWMILNFII